MVHPPAPVAQNSSSLISRFAKHVQEPLVEAIGVGVSVGVRQGSGLTLCEWDVL